MSNLFEQLGGEAAVNAAVDFFYTKVMADSRVNHFFDGIDMAKQIKKQKNFLTYAFGGPNHYSGLGMRNAHKRLVKEKGLNDTHFDIIIGHLGSTLTELKVPKELIAQAAAIAESTRKDVLNK
jgi:hemoglobin